MSQPISGVLITLPLAATSYNLLVLVIAAQTALGVPVTDGNCSECNLFNPNVADTVYVGGSDLTGTTEYGLPLVAGAAYRFGPYPFNGFPLSNVWVKGTANNDTLNVLLTSI